MEQLIEQTINFNFPKVEWLDVGPDDGPSQMFPSFFFLKGNKVKQNVLRHLNKKKKVSWGNKRFSFRVDSNSISRPTNHFEKKKKKARQNVEMKIWWIVMICTTFYLCTSSPPLSFTISSCVYTSYTICWEMKTDSSLGPVLSRAIYKGVNMLGHIVTKKGEEKHKMMSLDNKTWIVRKFDA